MSARVSQYEAVACRPRQPRADRAGEAQAAVSHSVADLRVRKRLSQIEERLGELRVRGQEMSDPRAECGRDSMAQAAGHARRAREHAAEAARLATVACLRSAQVHDHVADLYERLVAGGTGDVSRYRKQAGRHRVLAASDRALARRSAHDRRTVGTGGAGR